MAGIAEKRMMVKIARMYYDRDMTQAQIAARVNLSRQKVQRLLNKSRSTGIVHILITPAMGGFPDLERRIEEKYGLKDAVVIEPTDYNSMPTTVRETGAAAAEYLCGALHSGDRIAVAWGQSIAEMVYALYHHARPNVTGLEVVQAFGGLGDATYPEHITVLTQNIATWLGAQCTMMPAPAIAGSVGSRRAFCGDPDVALVLDKARSANIAVVGIGAMKVTGIRTTGVFARYPELANLADLGVAGDVNLRYFDKDGRPVRSEIDDRLIGLALKDFKKIDMVIGVAGGAGKVEAVRAALLGGFLNVLITDQVTAQKLLE